jgi:hypothetical protein
MNEVLGRLIRQLRAQVSRLATVCSEIWLVLDEPLLVGGIEGSLGYNWLSRMISDLSQLSSSELKLRLGIHCCGSLDEDLLLGIEFACYSFPLECQGEYLWERLTRKSEWRKRAESGAFLMLGLSESQVLRPKTVAQQCDTIARELGFSRSHLVLTSECGLVLMEPDWVETFYSALAKVAELLREER